MFDDPLRDGATVRWTYADLRDQRPGDRRWACSSRTSSPATASASSWATGPRRWRRSSARRWPGRSPSRCRRSHRRPSWRSCSTGPRSRSSSPRTGSCRRRFGDDVRSLAPSCRRCATIAVVGTSSGIGSSAAPSAGRPPLDRRTVDRHARRRPPWSSSAPARRASRRGCCTATAPPSLQFWVQAQIFGRHEPTRMWTSLPLFWTAGLNTAMGSTLAAGGCWVMQETFEPGAALALMARERVTEPYSLPHQTGALEEHPAWATTDLSSLQLRVRQVGLRPPPDGARRHRLEHAGGLRAVGDVRLLRRPLVDARRASCSSRAWAGSCPATSCASSTPTPARVLGAGRGRRARHQGPDADAALPRAAPPRSASTPTASSTPATPASSTSDGYVHFTGRRTEMIKTGGANVSPAELEVQLRACPPVKLSRIVGVADPRLDQIVVACITLKDGAEATEADIQAFLRERVAVLQGAQAGAVLRRRRDPDDRQRHQGARRRRSLALVEARLAADPDAPPTATERRPMTDPRRVRPRPVHGRAHGARAS